MRVLRKQMADVRSRSKLPFVSGRHRPTVSDDEGLSWSRRYFGMMSPGLGSPLEKPLPRFGTVRKIEGLPRNQSAARNRSLWSRTGVPLTGVPGVFGPRAATVICPTRRTRGAGVFLHPAPKPLSRSPGFKPEPLTVRSVAAS
jgi:hypothetical protein